MQLNNENETSEVAANADLDTVTPPVRKVPNRSTRRNFEKNISKYQDTIHNSVKSNRRIAKALKSRLKTLERLAGKEVVAKLKSVCVDVVPEVKNPEGEVVQPESRQLNNARYAAELELVIVAMRADRTTLGTRSGASGRGSKRKSLKNGTTFINNRNALIKEYLDSKADKADEIVAEETK